MYCREMLDLLSSTLRALSSQPHRRTGAPKSGRANPGPHSVRRLRRQRAARRLAGFSKSPRRSAPALWAPCAAVRRRRQAASAGIGRRPMPFRRYMDVPPKSPAPAHGLAAQGWAASAKRGGLSFGYFSLAKQRKVTRAPEAHEMFLILKEFRRKRRRGYPPRAGSHKRPSAAMRSSRVEAPGEGAEEERPA